MLSKYKLACYTNTKLACFKNIKLSHYTTIKLAVLRKLHYKGN